MQFSHIPKSLYPFILQLDCRIYPTKSSVTESVLSQWFQRNPEFGMISGSWPNIKGVCVAIPLNFSGWNRLIKGVITESDLTSRYIFDQNKDKALYLHIYHIEKFDSAIKKFHQLCFRALGQKIKNISKNCLIKGISAYCVSASGIDLFYNQLNFHEKIGSSEEYLLSKKKQIIVVDSKKKAGKKEMQGYRLIAKAKMLVSTPKEFSPAWKYFKTR